MKTVRVTVRFSHRDMPVLVTERDTLSGAESFIRQLMTGSLVFHYIGDAWYCFRGSDVAFCKIEEVDPDEPEELQLGLPLE